VSHEYESVRRVIYGDGDYEGATFVPVCEMCGRFVKPGTVTFRNDTMCGPTHMLFEGFI